jgi:ribosome modulation factor
MSDERKPVTTLAELDALDERDMVSGYRAGMNGAPEPSIEMNRDYWHGWRNGMADSGRIPIDEAMRTLCHEYVKRGIFA